MNPGKLLPDLTGAPPEQPERTGLGERSFDLTT
jgi:hypothetical protein